jgi:tetrahydromethanopterin S-methyltransferase subunit D
MAVPGYAWAYYRNNTNPTAGHGLVVVSSAALIIGAALGIFGRQKD